METTVKTGLKLCEDYFEEYGRPMLERDFSEYLEFISCGLVGEGSECLGYERIMISVPAFAFGSTTTNMKR